MERFDIQLTNLVEKKIKFAIEATIKMFYELFDYCQKAREINIVYLIFLKRRRKDLNVEHEKFRLPSKKA